jgi:hypothetical protein
MSPRDVPQCKEHNIAPDQVPVRLVRRYVPVNTSTLVAVYRYKCRRCAARVDIATWEDANGKVRTRPALV